VYRCISCSRCLKRCLLAMTKNKPLLITYANTEDKRPTVTFNQEEDLSIYLSIYLSLSLSPSLSPLTLTHTHTHTHTPRYLRSASSRVSLFPHRRLIASRAAMSIATNTKVTQKTQREEKRKTKYLIMITNILNSPHNVSPPLSFMR
jgi:hypothetical protein